MSTNDTDQRLAAGVWALVLVGAIIVAALPAETYVKTLVCDDALYYPTIARSIAQGQGPTFDAGLTLTNGCHPLWCLLQVPLGWCFGNHSPSVYLWWVKLLMVIIVVLMFYVWFRLIRTAMGDRIPAMVFLLLLGFYWWSISTLYSLMETPLVTLFIGLSLIQARRLDKKPQPCLREAAVLGTCLAATFLARLDSVFFITVLSAILLIRRIRQGQVRHLLVGFGVGVLLVLPYLYSNWIYFDSVIPISGLRKTVGLDLDRRLATLAGFWMDKWYKAAHILTPVAVVLISLLLLGGLLLLRRDLLRILTDKWRLLWALPAGAAAHSLYTWIFMSEGYVSWYHYTEYLTIYLLIATIAQAVAERFRRHRVDWMAQTLVPALGLLLVVLLVTYAPRKCPDPAKTAIFDMARWSKENLPADARYGMYDPGIFRFVSGRSTLALNGLAGDRELMALAQSRETLPVIERYDLDYIVTWIHAKQVDGPGREKLVYVSPEVLRTSIGNSRCVVVEANSYRSGDIDFSFR